MFSRDQWMRINGASNMFLGWGGEDDDLWKRIHAANMSVVNVAFQRGQFYEEEGRHARSPNPDRWKILRRPNTTQVMQTDGLKQVNYTRLKRKDFTSFIWMLLDV